ncbi:MAG: hypothetical protein IPK31_20830 [Chitinophagaceae bacterium]|nr:hypothetical protein [Chitinophagaceae bacterium]
MSKGYKKRLAYSEFFNLVFLWFFVAQVVDVQMVNGQPKVKKVFCAVNCGRVINLSGAEPGAGFNC